MILSIFEFAFLLIFAITGGLAVLYLFIRSVITLAIKDSGEIKALKLEEKVKFDKMVEQLDIIMNRDQDMSEDYLPEDEDISDEELDDFEPIEVDEEYDDDENDEYYDFDDDLEDEEPEYGEDELAPIDEILKKYKK